MATREDYEQLKAFARIDGAITGGLWILSFALFVAGFQQPMLSTLSVLTGIFSLVLASIRLRRFRDNILDGVISFRRAFGYSIFTYLYASLLLAAAQYIYFQFMDHGFVISQYMAMGNLPEFKQLLQLYGITAEEMKLAMDTLAQLRAIDIALQFFTMNIFMGLALSLPVASINKSSNKRIK
ncbi:MAG: DUF4199 domain-containing protein [Bacteroidales bacterium]|nr:DUF4199 domain-containing protein [Bacteroidales bacterium]MDY2693432.1 DUF4199 domain-containing protein [Prevotella sp.]MDD5787921.1 DUF4199 domain-containing protein [Bacteroidales bacterium]MDD6898385.1 DUF4199 domain-containing protein [Bacteroidales bacterium]MDY4732786.1 DUF4199 domain-containing protein [Prevotella sp.]